MLFNSFPYIFLFLPLSVIVYFALNKVSEIAGKYWLVIVSLIFYSFGTLTYLPLLLLSIVINYAISIVIRKNNQTNPETSVNDFRSANSLKKIITKSLSCHRGYF